MAIITILAIFNIFVHKEAHGPLFQIYGSIIRAIQTDAELICYPRVFFSREQRQDRIQQGNYNRNWCFGIFIGQMCCNEAV